jgi:hypothetical protein
MPKANIHNRRSLEAVYPPNAFAADAAENGRSPTVFQKGIRVLSAPDAAGEFALERATRQVGEAPSASFLAPQRCEERVIDAGRDSPTVATAEPDPSEGYEDFLTDLIAVAQQFGFKSEESPGRDEPRLRGLRQ